MEKWKSLKCFLCARAPCFCFKRLYVGVWCTHSVKNGDYWLHSNLQLIDIVKLGLYDSKYLIGCVYIFHNQWNEIKCRCAFSLGPAWMLTNGRLIEKENGEPKEYGYGWVTWAIRIEKEMILWFRLTHHIPKPLEISSPCYFNKTKNWYPNTFQMECDA